MTDRKFGKYPRSTPIDIANLATQSGIGAIPVVGGAAAPLIAAIVTAPLERRREAWFDRLADGLRELEGRFEGFNPQELADNEEFVSAVYEATDAAMKSSSDARRERLANVVLNIAAGRTLNDALRGRFTALLHSFSDEHVLMLRICRAPLSFPKIKERSQTLTMGARADLYEQQFAEHGVSGDLISVVERDLNSEGMIDGSSMHVTMSGQGLVQPCITKVGLAFLAFIESPIA